MNKYHSGPKKGTLTVISTLLSTLFAVSIWAGDLDPSSREALNKTLDILTQPQLRNEAVKENSNTQFVHQQAKSIGGSEANTQEIYELAADIFKTLIEKSGGDPLAAMEQLEKFKNDPKSLEGKLTPAQLAKLHTLAKKITVGTEAKTPASTVK